MPGVARLIHSGFRWWVEILVFNDAGSSLSHISGN